jgi:hypothetical protein
MDLYTTTWLSVGVLIGFMLGYTTHTLFIRYYLKKHMGKHPDFKMFMDVLDKNISDEDEQEKK